MPLITAGSRLSHSQTPDCSTRSTAGTSASILSVRSRSQRYSSGALRGRGLLVMSRAAKTLVSFGKDPNQKVARLNCAKFHPKNPFADVDGTLIRTVGDKANKLHKLAFINAWKEAAAKLKEMEDSMLKYYMANADKAGVGLECLPGVKQLLQELKDRDDVLTCLVTGNLQPIGWAKMEALGIKHLFSEPYFGGFGSDHCNPDNSDQSWKDRAELVKIAAQKAERHFPGVEWKAKWHVGDTPMDIQAAGGGKAHALGVLTGIYSRQDLEGCGAESIILENLQDVPSVLKAMNL